MKTDQFLNILDGPNTARQQISGFSFDSQYEVQSRFHTVSNLTVRGGELRIVEGGIFTIKDAQNDTVLTYNADTNKITFVSAVAGMFQETRFEFHAVNGFTGNQNFEFSGPAANQFPIISIDSTGWGTNVIWYADYVANGDPPLPLVSCIVDLTNGTVTVANTIGTSGTTSAATYNRVGPFILSTGTIQYAYQQKKGGTDSVFPAIVSAALIAHHL